MRWLALGLLLGGCAFRVATEGPVTVMLGPSDRVKAFCSSMAGQPARGCLIVRGTSVTVVCGYNDHGCLAHEIRHLVEPGWRH